MRRAILLLGVLLMLATTAFAAPANDNFAAATPIIVPSVNIQSTVGATTELLEAAPCGAIGSTVWFSFAVGVGQPVALATAGSSYDTVVAVYRGTSLTDLVLVACNDDFPIFAPPAYNSTVTFTAAVGITYWIQAGGFAAQQGDLVLAVV